MIQLGKIITPKFPLSVVSGKLSIQHGQIEVHDDDPVLQQSIIFKTDDGYLITICEYENEFLLSVKKGNQVLCNLMEFDTFSSLMRHIVSMYGKEEP